MDAFETAFGALVGTQLDTAKPILIVIQLGTNDLNRGATPIEFETSMQEMIDQIVALCPACTIQLDSPIPALRQSREALRLYRDKLLDLAAANPEAYFGADLTESWDRAIHAGLDGTHPSATGTLFIAAQKAAAIMAHD